MLFEFLDQILAFVGELADSKLLSFILSTQNLDSTGRLSPQEHRSTHLVTLQPGARKFAGLLTLRQIERTRRFYALQLLTVGSKSSGFIFFLVRLRLVRRWFVDLRLLVFAIGICVDQLDLLAVEGVNLLKLLTSGFGVLNDLTFLRGLSSTFHSK